MDDLATVDDAEVGQWVSYCGDVCCSDEVSFISGSEVSVDEIADFSREREKSHDAGFAGDDAKHRLLIGLNDIVSQIFIDEISRVSATTTGSVLGVK